MLVERAAHRLAVRPRHRGQHRDRHHPGVPRCADTGEAEPRRAAAAHGAHATASRAAIPPHDARARRRHRRAHRRPDARRLRGARVATASSSTSRLLTGEADPVDKEVGDEVLSGSLRRRGIRDSCRATRVGPRLLRLEARRRGEQVRRSRGRSCATRSSGFIKVVSCVPGAGRAASSSSRSTARTTATSAPRSPAPCRGVITMVPEGLVLLTSVAMAVSVIRLAQKKALVQDMPAVEVLARVDVVCVDKTGTLTEPGMARAAGRGSRRRAARGRRASAPWARASPSPTRPSWRSPRSYPSADGWTVTRHRAVLELAQVVVGRPSTATAAWVLGAPEMLLPDGHDVRSQADGLAQGGARVLLLARSAGEPAERRRPRRARARGARGHQPDAALGRRGDGRVLPRAERHG